MMKPSRLGALEKTKPDGEGPAKMTRCPAIFVRSHGRARDLAACDDPKKANHLLPAARSPTGENGRARAQVQAQPYTAGDGRRVPVFVFSLSAVSYQLLACRRLVAARMKFLPAQP